LRGRRGGEEVEERLVGSHAAKSQSCSISGGKILRRRAH
jgi:hypothetical protein